MKKFRMMLMVLKVEMFRLICRGVGWRWKRDELCSERMIYALGEWFVLLEDELCSKRMIYALGE